MKLIKLLVLLIIILVPQEALAVLTSGNVTIKLSAGTYSTWAAFWDDIGNLTGNITCTVDASAFTEDTAPAHVTEDLNGYTLHILPAAFPTTTDASTGARFTCNYTDEILNMQMEGAGEVIIEGMVFIEGTSRPSYCISLSTIIVGSNIIIRRNIIKGCANGIYSGNIASNVLQIYNNIVYNSSDYCITLNFDNETALIANNTCVESANDNIFVGNELFTLENNLSYGAVASDFSFIASLTIGNNNACSDLTGEDADWGGGGTNNLTEIADPFTAIGSDDFTISEAGALVIGAAGKDLSGTFTTDFFGVTRVNWTIGAVEYEGAIVEEVTIKLSAGTYSSWAAFWDDRSNLATDVTCTVDASAFTEGAAPATITENLNGYTLHVLPAAFPTATDASDGARFTFNFDGANLLNMSMEGAGTVIIEGMVFIEGSPTTYGVSSVSITTVFNFIVRRNIFKGLFYGINSADATMDTGIKWYNNILYDLVLKGVITSVNIPNAVIANNTMVDCDKGVDAENQVATFENNLCYSSTTADYWSIGTNTIGNNNADSDATGENADWGGGGANNVNSIADPFNNLGADDFTITAEGVIGTAGKDLSGSFTTDFFGVTRVNWTIGALEFAAGWTGKLLGATNPAGVIGVDVSNVAKIIGVE